MYTGTSDMAVSEGRVVRLSGSAGEFNDVTQVSLDSEVLDCGAGSVTTSDPERSSAGRAARAAGRPESAARYRCRRSPLQ